MSRDLLAYSNRRIIQNIVVLAIILVIIIIIGSLIIGFFSLLGFSELNLNPIREILDFVRTILLSAILTIGLLIFLWIRGRS
jgi:hypothetical protein